jgi:S-DNA-T family DNA segregation ATPase FtsK/SpoIIIE
VIALTLNMRKRKGEFITMTKQNFAFSARNKHEKKSELLIFEREFESQTEKNKVREKLGDSLKKEYKNVSFLGGFDSVSTFMPSTISVPQAGKIQRFPRLLPQWDPEQKRIVRLIEEKTAEMECVGKVTGINSGPIVTEYEFQPDRFTRVKRLKSIHEDLAVAIPAESVAVQRIPGKGVVGITVPNKDRKSVDFPATLKHVVDHRYDMALPLNLGIRSNGEPFVDDLANLPHLLVAGSTGAGKSVLLNGIITSLINVRSPYELVLHLIDPKSVELLPYKDLPHVVADPVSGIFEALALMEKVSIEMRRRTSYLHFHHVKNLKELNAKLDPKDRLPYWVLIIDEMCDLVLQEKKLFIARMAEISSMARAAGIHVIAATQRPSVDVLAGKVKVNFPARLAFSVPGEADSRTILTRKGAEQLLGKGDMYYMSPYIPGLLRLHAPFCQQKDIDQMLAASIKLGRAREVPCDNPDSNLPITVSSDLKSTTGEQKPSVAELDAEVKTKTEKAIASVKSQAPAAKVQ